MLWSRLALSRKQRAAVDVRREESGGGGKMDEREWKTKDELSRVRMNIIPVAQKLNLDIALRPNGPCAPICHFPCAVLALCT